MTQLVLALVHTDGRRLLSDLRSTSQLGLQLLRKSKVSLPHSLPTWERPEQLLDTDVHDNFLSHIQGEEGEHGASETYRLKGCFWKE